MTTALEGIRVLDLTGMGPAGCAAMTLGDMGADVIRIDLPVGSSGSRGVGDGLVQHLLGDPDEAARWFASLSRSRNRKNVTINLRSEAGQRVFHKLVETADVVLEAFRPGVMDRMNAGYETLSSLNPRLIYCAVSGYGQTGPYHNIPGHDANFAAMGGVLALIGRNRQEAPVCAVNVVADMAIAFVNAALGIALALLARERTGRGQMVDISMTDGVISLLTGIPGAMEYFHTRALPKRGETLTSGTTASYYVYRTKDDKWLTVCPIEPKFWANLCRALGHEEYIPLQYDRGRQQEMIDTLQGIFLTRTRDEWFDLLAEADVPVGKVLEFDELQDDPQVKARQMFLDVKDPRFGVIRQFGFGIKLSDTPATIRNLGGAVGSDTEAVLREAGYSPDELDELRRQGAI
jgi:crotonobetainyl-CoA:carnitine CoA-transferase CaiB-like acyl-CoA transferase